MHVKCASFAAAFGYMHFLDCVVYCNKRLFLYKKVTILCLFYTVVRML